MLGMDQPSVITVKSTQLTREQILATTARCLCEKGYDATTIRTIAAMLDCAVGSIYRYFRDKRDLLTAVTQQSLKPVLALQETQATLEQSMQLYFEKATLKPEVYQLMFWLAVVGQPSTQHVSADGSSNHNRALPAIVAKIIHNWAQQLNDATLANDCWASLHGSILAGHDLAHALASVERTLARTLSQRLTDNAAAQTTTTVELLGSFMPSQLLPSLTTLDRPNLTVTLPTTPVRTTLPVTKLSAPPAEATQKPQHDSDDVCLL